MLPAVTYSTGNGVAIPDMVTMPGVPPVTVPATNFMPGGGSVGCSLKVLIMGSPAFNLATMRPMTTDAPSGGMPPGLFGTHTSGSPTVLFEGTPATRISDLTTGNGGNCMGMEAGPGCPGVLIE